MTALLMLKLTLTPEDLAWIEARYRQFREDRAKYCPRRDSGRVVETRDVPIGDSSSRQPESLPGGAPAESGAVSSDDCPECENERVTLNWHDCIVKPCPVCRPKEYTEFMRRRAEETGIEHRDPWSLADEELNLTCALPREDPRYYRDRAEYDEYDDKSDLQPFTRTTGYK